MSHAGKVILRLTVDIKKLAIFEEIRGKILNSATHGMAKAEGEKNKSQA
ncbi:MAG: hypothetical protein HQL01_15465 [Nitrospirae bacterium]|nr:hypothetical protein [Nitrospirota bacterium]